MTPAERAREIDRQEFETECKAARDRALAYVNHCRQLEKQRVQVWIGVTKNVVNKINQLQLSDRAHRHTVNGESKTLGEWAKIIGITPKALLGRRRRLGSMEAAIAFQPTGRWAKRPAPGVSLNFAPSEGTGAGSTAQETPKITFSEKA
ncbi:hypothetical protein ACC755_21255 [Rhizobium ruizarguesonis]|uniref:hypothetical protein n=1 Tax=Rhizobium ruizarguesonis TaxID=2081791 RepID=UPI001030C9F3|nr:hypothetical protein [Rhizobium ruizarguesonis]TAY93604.1 hypothetical protein ELH85_10695 [Rhizobium ruizarguesonis]